MDPERLIPLVAMPVMLLLVEIGAVFLALPLQGAGISAFENPESIANPFIFILILLAFTLLLLVLIRYRHRNLISLIILVSIFFTYVYIFAALSFVFLGDSLVGVVLPFVLSGLATYAIYRFPEWYVIDTLGLLIAAGVASIFGISLDIIPVIILLSILAVYDAISVYKTKHMITLAEGVVELKTPILFIIPKRRDYSYIKEGIGNISEGERGAFIIGMGDLIMPSVLVVSANVFVQGTKIGIFTIPAIGAIIGSIVGLLFLIRLVGQGKPQAGLPPLNGGAIIGFSIAYLITMI